MANGEAGTGLPKAGEPVAGLTLHCAELVATGEAGTGLPNVGPHAAALIRPGEWLVVTSEPAEQLPTVSRGSAGGSDWKGGGLPCAHAESSRGRAPAAEAAVAGTARLTAAFATDGVQTAACAPSLGLGPAATDGVTASDSVSVLSAVLSPHGEASGPVRSSFGVDSSGPLTATLVAGDESA